MKEKCFYSEMDFWMWVEEQVDGLDINETLLLPPTWFSLKGEEYREDHIHAIADRLNEFADLKLDSEKCFMHYPFTYMMVFKGEDEVEDFSKLISLEKEVEKDGEDEDSKSDNDGSEEQGQELSGKEQQSKKEVDWEMINALENKKWDREKLRTYAEDNFSIKLNKKFTITNMIKSFKEQLGE